MINGAIGVGMSNKKQLVKDHIDLILKSLPENVGVVNMEMKVTLNSNDELVVGEPSYYGSGSFLRFQIKRPTKSEENL